MGVARASKRRSAKRLSLARSLDDLEVGTEFVPFSLGFIGLLCVSFCWAAVLRLHSTNVDIQMNHPPFSFCSTLCSFLTFHFRCLELCVRCYTCGTRGPTKWSLCGPEPRPCLFGLANEDCCTTEYRAHIFSY